MNRSRTAALRDGWSPHRPSALLHLLLGSLVAALAASAPAHATLPEFAKDAEWKSLSTAHFLVVTDAGPGAGADVAGKLERFSQALGQLNPGLRSVSQLPTTVYGFRNQGDL